MGGEYEYFFPLCDFDGGCVRDDPDANDQLKRLQNSCCLPSALCNTKINPTECMGGDACITSFLGRVGAP